MITHPHIDHIADLENLYTYNIKPLAFRRPRAASPLQTVPSDTQAQKSLTWSETPRSVFTTRKDGTITFTFNPDKTWRINTNTTEY